MKKSLITPALSTAIAAVSLVACSAGDSPSGGNSQLGGSGGNPTTGGTIVGSAGGPTTGGGATTTGVGVTTTGVGVSTTGPASTGSASVTGGNTGNVTSGIFFDGSVSVGDSSDQCGLQHFDLLRKPGEVLLVLDRSASMKDVPDGATDGVAKWDIVVPSLKGVITATDTAVSWGLKTFPEGEGSECATGSVTSKIDVPIAPMNAASVDAAITATTPAGNGTPTGDAVNAAVTYLKSINDDNPKYILLATDGEPSCAGTTKDSTSARTYAVTAVTNAYNAGFDTFVVGIATTKTTDSTTLSNLATAGGKARPRTDPNPLAPYNAYYLASTQSELSAAVNAVTVDVTQNCIFNLKTPPPQPDNIRVCIGAAGECLGDGGATKVPHDTSDAGTNGWTYTGAGYSTVQVWGSWCDQIKASGADQVQIIYGCPKIDVRVN